MKLNNLNLKLQGPDENIITSTTSLNAFNEKLSLWIEKVDNNIFDFLPVVKNSSIKSAISSQIRDTLCELKSSLHNYFPNLSIDHLKWIINPYSTNLIIDLNTACQEEFIDLKNNLLYQLRFSELILPDFWVMASNEYPLLGLTAIKILLPFASSWYCEFGFSALTEIKNRKRERLTSIDSEMRACLASLEPRFDKICGEKQDQRSH